MLPQEVYTYMLQNAGTFQPFLPPCLWESFLHEVISCILLRGHKQRRKKIDRRKEQVSELKENRHYACHRYCGMEGLMALESLLNLDDASEGHKFLWLWNCGWNIHQSRPSLRGLRGRKTHTTTQKCTHTYGLFSPHVFGDRSIELLSVSPNFCDLNV